MTIQNPLDSNETPKPKLRLVEADTTVETGRYSEFSLKLLDSQESLVDAGRLRAATYLEKGYISSEQIDENGCEFDEFDKHSVHLGVYGEVPEGDNKLVGYVRLIKKNESHSLPVEHNYPSLYVPKGSVEVSRLIVDESEVTNRKDRVDIMVSLIRAMTVEALEEDAPQAYATLEVPLLSRLQRVGINFEPVSGEAYLESYKTVNLAVRIKPSQVAKGIWEKDTTLYGGSNGFYRSNPRGGYGRFFDEAISSKEYEGAVAPGKLSMRKEQAVERNLGFLSEKEQAIINTSVVAIAGTGGDGGELAVNLARLGVQSFKLADPENFDIENLNRQTGSSLKTVGRNKALVIAEEILHINPDANIEVFTHGVTEKNAEQFMSNADLIIDESEFTSPEVGVLIARAARERELPVLMAFNVGFGAYVTSYAPDGMTLEKRLGIPEDMPLEDIAKTSFSLDRWIGTIPVYADMYEFAKLDHNTKPAPSVVQGVSMAAGVGATEAVMHLIHGRDNNSKRPIPHIAPRAVSVDAISGTTEIRFPRTNYYRTLGRAVLRTVMGRNVRIGKNKS